MLIQFSVENFMSFRDKIQFSMAATSLKELPENIFTLDDVTKLLKTAVIYGPNAAGKSNLIYALRIIRNLILSGTREGTDDHLPEVKFMLDEESSTNPTKFTIDFIAKEVNYNYQVSFTSQNVVEESLYSYPHGRPRLLFERKSNTKDEKRSPIVKFGETFSTEAKAEEVFLKHLKPRALLLSVADFLNIGTVAPVFEWFRYGLCPVMDVSQIDHKDRQLMAEQLNEDSNLLKWVKEMIGVADLGISDLDIFELKKLAEVNTTEQRKKTKYDFSTIHNIYDQSGQSIGKTLMPWEWESQGTAIFLILLPIIYRMLQTGGTLLLDELGAQLHPVLVLRILQLFNDPKNNPKNAQLIFTTHLTTLLDNDILRRDQVWFVEKKKGETSDLYSLAEFRPTPRKGEALEKGYLQGRYGALPFIGELKI